MKTPTNNTTASHSKTKTIKEYRTFDHFRPEIIQLAEELERLPPGDYSIIINKPDMKGLPWRAEISKTDRIRIVDLMR